MLHELIFASNAAPILGAKRREIHSLQLTQYSYQCAQLENPLYFVILMKNPQGNFRAYDAKTLHHMKDWRGEICIKDTIGAISNPAIFRKALLFDAGSLGTAGRSF